MLAEVKKAAKAAAVQSLITGEPPRPIKLPRVADVTLTGVVAFNKEVRDPLLAAGATVVSNQVVNTPRKTRFPGRVQFATREQAAAFAGATRYLQRAQKALSRLPAWHHTPNAAAVEFLATATERQLADVIHGMQIISAGELPVGAHVKEVGFPSGAKALKTPGVARTIATLIDLPQKYWGLTLSDTRTCRLYTFQASPTFKVLDTDLAVEKLLTNPPEVLLLHENAHIPSTLVDILAGTSAVALSGTGNDLSHHGPLANLPCQIIYSGDIDRSGFAILSRARHLLAPEDPFSIKSLGMTLSDLQETLLHVEPITGRNLRRMPVDETYLTPEEIEALDALCGDSDLLEQENFHLTESAWHSKLAP